MDKGEQLRAEHVSSARRMVVKVGTNVLTDADGLLDEARIASVAGQVSWLAGAGREVVLVSSGAIGAGMRALNMSGRPTLLPLLQASASVGQGMLMAQYERHFSEHGRHAAQILLTRADFDSRERYLNAANTINALLGLSCIPVVNENDSISTDELKFGDNDFLAALVTHLVRAELLVILTSVAGLYTHRPSGSAAPEVVDVVEKVDDGVKGLAYSERTPGGIGGMESKLDAARIATEAGEAAVIADGTEDGVLRRIVSGAKVGTLFVPAQRRLSSYKRWLRFTSRPRGSVRVDQGARRAVERRGKSLLPSGVVGVTGSFQPGDAVRIEDAIGEEFARGLSNYSSDEIEQIMGRQTHQIEAALGYKYYDEVVHRDNLALLD